MKSRKLSEGTQTIPMMEITDTVCRCGRALNWYASDEDELVTHRAKCRCGMMYEAWQAEIKVEGIDSNLYV